MFGFGGILDVILSVGDLITHSIDFVRAVDVGLPEREMHLSRSDPAR